MLLTHVRTLALGVIIDDAPYISMVPFALSPTRDALLIHASALAKHSQGLQIDAPFSALIAQPDNPEADPLQLARVTLQGEIARIDRDDSGYSAARSAYIGKFPTSAPTFTLGDFHLFSLSLDKARYVAGFARTFNLNAERIREILSG
jgi:putative heme iron utilization protein